MLFGIEAAPAGIGETDGGSGFLRDGRFAALEE
jgi:hypothetical protein